jgi:hypothetical protein
MSRKGKVKVFRSAEEWGEIFARQLASGKSVVEFCGEEGLVRTSFEKWRRRLKGQGSGSHFKEVPAELLSEAGRELSVGSCAVELELGAGIRLVIRR